MDNFRRNLTHYENFDAYRVVDEYSYRHAPSPSSSAGTRRLSNAKTKGRRLARRRLAETLRRDGE